MLYLFFLSVITTMFYVFFLHVLEQFLDQLLIDKASK